ncbi:MAG: hypothetical protein KKH60_03705, partial [Proteobacteria bacterium]|nr:hypothetical protein [Pseudomonadota bacterium]
MGHTSVGEELKLAEEYGPGGYGQENGKKEERLDEPTFFPFFDFPVQACCVAQQQTETGDKSKQNTSKQTHIQGISDKVVIFLDHVKGAMVGRHLVYIERNKRNDRG